MDQTAIGLAVRGIDERTPGDTTEQALQPELDDAHALLGRVDELAAVSQHLAQSREITARAGLVHGEPHGGPRPIGHRGRRDDDVSRRRRARRRDADGLDDEIRAPLDLRQMHRQLVDVLDRVGRVQDDAAAAWQPRQEIDGVGIRAVHRELHAPVSGGIDDRRHPQEPARRERRPYRAPRDARFAARSRPCPLRGLYGLVESARGWRRAGATGRR